MSEIKKGNQISRMQEYFVHTALSRMQEVTQTELAILWYINIDEKTLKLSAWSLMEDVQSIELEMFDLLTEGRNYYTDDKIEEKNVLDEFAKSLKMEIKNAMFLPVYEKDSLYGYIQLVNVHDYSKGLEKNSDLNYLTGIVEESILSEIKSRKDNRKIVSLENVKKTFSVGNLKVPVLKGISLDIYEGELIVILGASGSGKTTLLNLIGGMDELTEGSFFFEEQDFSIASEKVLTNYRRNSVGFIFQTYNLMPNLNAKDNLDFVAALCKNPLNSIEVLRSVGMEEHMKKYPSQLSGGQQQRVSIARALVKNPKIILADEPTAALDYTNSIEILKILQEIVSKGSTLVMVTHNEEIAKMANRIIRIKDGVIQKVVQNEIPELAESLKW